MATKKDKVNSKVLTEGVGLTKRQAELLDLYVNQFYTPKQISYRLKISGKRVYKILSDLKKKGLLEWDVDKDGGGIPPVARHPVRLHGQQFRVLILWKDSRYGEISKRSNMALRDGNTVRFNEGSIEIYGQKSFFGEDVRQCLSQSMIYYTRILRGLENDLKVVLLKPRSCNVKMVKAEFAEIHNEIAKDYHYRGESGIRVHSLDDGRLWFLIDNSFSLHEMETVHPVTSGNDMEKVAKQVNDWRKFDPPTMSELAVKLEEIREILRSAADLNKETAAGLNVMVKLNNPGLINQERKFEIPEYIG